MRSGSRPKFIATLLVAAVILTFLAWMYRPALFRGGNELSPTSAAATSPGTATARQPAPQAQTLPRSTLADSLNSPAADIRTDLRLLADIVGTFRSNFPGVGNPVGNNVEITAALTGRNPLSLSLIPANHTAINAAGELCDRWGTPFFFHAFSASQMEIRSAGPDRKLWTGDDVVRSP